MEKLRSQRGMSAIELLAALAVLVALALFSAMPLMEAMRNSRLRAAARQLAGDVRFARSKATSTGWQYRIAGVSAGAAGHHRNQYRLMARAAESTAWPDANTGPFEDATLFVAKWVELDEEFPGVRLNPGDSSEFALTFDSRGTPVEMSLNFDPLEVASENGETRRLAISAVGNVRLD